MDRTAAPSSAQEEYPSQEDEALRRVLDRTTPRKTPADVATFAAASHLSPRGLAALARLEPALKVGA